jgi:hypothetical protein
MNREYCSVCGRPGPGCCTICTNEGVPPPLCGCIRCLRERDDRTMGLPTEYARMIVCRVCGNKRCPHAADHRFVCTGSNEPGQIGEPWPEYWWEAVSG